MSGNITRTRIAPKNVEVKKKYPKYPIDSLSYRHYDVYCTDKKIYNICSLDSHHNALSDSLVSSQPTLVQQFNFEYSKMY